MALPIAFAILQYAQGGIRRERSYKDPLDPLAIDDNALLLYYRFPRCEILLLSQELEPYLKRDTERGHAIPVLTQVLTALRFYASGTFQNVLADTVGLHQSTVSRVIKNVTNILAIKATQEIKMPETAAEIMQATEDYASLRDTRPIPRCIGAIDCTHILVKPPRDLEPVFLNYKRKHSINIQVIGSATFKICHFVAKYPGSVHDSFIWRNSNIKDRFVNGDFGDSLIIGDSGYPLEPWLMTPIEHPNLPSERRFNNSHKGRRVVIEQTFGILKSRFRCLCKSGGVLQYKPKKCAHIAVACFLLHNRCIDRKIPNPGEDGYVPEPPNAPDPPLGPPARRALHGANVRDNIILRFFS